MNSVVLVGRLTRDPELRFIASTSRAVANFTLAINRPFSRNDEADFLRIVVWGNQAEHVAKYLKKGSQCAVRGSIQTGSYQDKDGNTRYTTDIVADYVEFLGSPGGGSRREDQEPDYEPPKQTDDFPTIDDDDIPF